MTEYIDGALGEGSQFHMTHGFYVHGVSIQTAFLPVGWSDRTVEVSHPVGTKGYAGLCLEAHDLAAAKLVAYREKDRIFVATLLAEGLIDGAVLLQRVATLSIEDSLRDKLNRWVRMILSELDENA